MGKILIRILLVLVVGCSLAEGLYLLFERGYKRFSANFTEIYEGNSTHDILFLGSSRVQATIIPAVIDSLVGSDSYNGGINGGNLIEFKTTLKGYLMHHPAPKLVVVGVDLEAFGGKRTFFNPIVYFPYINNIAVDETFNAHEYHTFAYHYLPFLLFSQLDDYNRLNGIKGLGTAGSAARALNIKAKGYTTIYNGTLRPSALALPTEKSKVEIRPQLVGYLREIMELCQHRGIQVAICYLPEYDRYIQRYYAPNHREILDTIVAICTEYKAPFLNHGEIALAQDSNLFYDVRHLNPSGSYLYSRFLGPELKKIKNY